MAYSLDSTVWPTNRIGIDRFQDVTVTSHPSFTKLTEMNGPNTGAQYLTISSTVIIPTSNNSQTNVRNVVKIRIQAV